MSFILDALKKSENERQRQAGPGFASMPESSATKSRSIWPIVLIALVAINLVVLGVIIMRSDRDPAGETTAQRGPASPDQEPVVSTPAAPPTQPPPSGPTVPAVRPAPPAPAEAAGTAAPPSGTVADADERQVRRLQGEAAPEPVPAPAETTDAPARPSDEPPRPAAVTRPTETTPQKPSTAVGADALPTANDLRLQGFLTGPPLHLDLHVYYPESHRRVIFISGTKYKEGDRVKDGSVVREIVPEGVILEDRGRRYLLLPD